VSLPYCLFPGITALVGFSLFERFQWVACQLDELGKCLTLSKLRQALASLPHTLDATYERILCAIDEAYVGHVVHILKWICVSERPLRLKELAHVVAINREGNPFFDEDEVFTDPSDIVRICSSLIGVVSDLNDDDSSSTWSMSVNADKFSDISPEVIPGTMSETSTDDLFAARLEDGDNSEQSMDDDSDDGENASCDLQHIPPRMVSDGVIRLAHYSVKEYLVSERIKQGSAKHFSFQSASASAIVAEDCLAYICHSDQSTPRFSANESSFLKYTCQHWPTHARYAGEYNILVSRSLLKSFWRSSSAVSLWTSTGKRPLYWSFQCGFGASDKLYLAALHGLRESARFLIDEEEADVNSQKDYNGTPLFAASRAGHIGMVGNLLAAGADPNVQGGSSRNALCAAAYSGHDAIVNMLIRAGADVNAQGGYLGTALQAAAFYGAEAVIGILLGAGAYATAQCGEFGSALQAAAVNRNDTIVRMLLDAGADPNTQGGDYSTALQAAVCYENESTIRILLDAAADPNAQGGVDGNALQAAAIRGKEPIVRILLDAAADPNAQGGKYGNALQAAAFNGEESIVRILLDAGADPNTQGGKYGNALQAAAYGYPFKAGWGRPRDRRKARAYNRHTSTIRKLLDAGADPNIQGNECGNSLEAASMSCDPGNTVSEQRASELSDDALDAIILKLFRKAELTSAKWIRDAE
jgi:ankyrin repeat protein